MGIDVHTIRAELPIELTHYRCLSFGLQPTQGGALELVLAGEGCAAGCFAITLVLLNAVLNALGK